MQSAKDEWLVLPCSAPRLRSLGEFPKGFLASFLSSVKLREMQNVSKTSDTGCVNLGVCHHNKREFRSSRDELLRLMVTRTLPAISSVEIDRHVLEAVVKR